jgi:predicted ArsR family transcriptional regulator
MMEKPLIENLYKTKDAQERAIQIWFLRIEGYTETEIAKKLNISRTTVWKHLKKIKETGAVLTYEGIEEMKQKYKGRKELLIRRAFKELDTAQKINDKIKLMKLISHLIDTEADAFWRNVKREEVEEESPLSMAREWIHGAAAKEEEEKYEKKGHIAKFA